MIQRMTKTLTATMMLSGMIHAADIEVKILNMTGGSYFTPLLAAVHPESAKLFHPGNAASPALQAMAEGGDVAMLSSHLNAAGSNVNTDPANGLLAPGQSTMTTLTSTTSNDHLSIVAMILPTNDGFVAVNGWKIPQTPGTYHVHANAYDAGTEGNDEIVNGAGAPGAAGIPADPGGHAGSAATGINAPAEGFVHIHRGVLGDTDANGGVSDLVSTRHRWLNPVATVVVTVK